MRLLMEGLQNLRRTSATIWVVLSIAIPLCPNSSAWGQNERALGVLFGDENLGDVLYLKRSTSRMSDEEKWPHLWHSVLPAGRDVVRIDIDFAPAHAVDSVAEEYDLGDPWAAYLAPAPDLRSPVGGELLSPAMDLVDAGRRLGRLPEIHRELNRRSSRSESAQKCRQALQILVSIAAGEHAAAAEQIVEFTTLVTGSSVIDAERGPEAVVIRAGSAHQATRSATLDLAFLVYEQTRAELGPRSERWHRHVYALTYLLDWLTWHMNIEGSSLELPRWQPIERMTAETNGLGFPLARWSTRRGEANRLTGHDRDYLLFAVPLIGEFTIEAETSTFDYHDIRLGYGGTWAGPSYDLKSLLSGGFHADDDRLPIDPPLPHVRERLRVRIDVRDGRRTTMINGRTVFEDGVSTDDPWLSLFSYWYTHGWVRNLRISGNPVIPDRIDLATRRELRGWSTYFDETIATELADWRLVDSTKPGESPASGPVLVGARREDLAGAWQESLLRYHRPFFEDGIIEYEFYYQPGEYAVHPVLGRCAFLLEPEGVQRHWITDGRYDRTGLDPMNREPVLSPETPPVSLRMNAWNTAGLRVSGDVMSILLNGDVVAREAIDSTSQRQFGLFHYADRSEVRVRNIRWHGDWPRELAPPPDQELADDAIERLIAGPELTAVFEHEFSTGLPLDRFLVTGDGWSEQMEQREDGVFLRREGREGYNQSMIIPHLELSGDFDIVAEFADFAGETVDGGHANIHLLVSIEGRQTDCRLFRKFSRYNHEPEPIIQSAIFETRNGQTRYLFPEKDAEISTAGCLRLVRRGTQLYYLYAADDSSNYRLLDSAEVPPDSTRPLRLRLILEAHKPGHAEVTWKSLRVRAERMSGLSMQASDPVKQLDERRDRLPQRLKIDFRRDEDRRHYSQFGGYASFATTDEGLELTVPGSDNWMGAGVRPQLGLRGDFDISLEVDVPKLEQTVADEESVVYLEAEVGGDDGPRVDVKYAISQRGVPAAELQLRMQGVDGDDQYVELGSLPAMSISTLRIARRGATAYVLFQEQADQPLELLGRLDVGLDPVLLGGLAATVHTGGAGRETIALFRTMDLAAEEFTTNVP